MASEKNWQWRQCFDRVYAECIRHNVRYGDFLADEPAGVQAERIASALKVARAAADAAYPQPVVTPLEHHVSALLVYVNNKIDPKAPELQSLISAVESALLRHHT